MTVLEARPLGLFLNCGYGIYQDSQRVAKVTFSAWGSGGKVIMPSGRYRVRLRGPLLKTTTCLMQGKVTVAEAKSPLVPPVLRLTHGGRTYEVRFLNNALTVEGGVVINTFQTEVPPWFRRRVRFTLPDTLPQTHQLLLVWMALEQKLSD